MPAHLLARHAGDREAAIATRILTVDLRSPTCEGHHAQNEGKHPERHLSHTAGVFRTGIQEDGGPFNSSLS